MITLVIYKGTDTPAIMNVRYLVNYALERPDLSTVTRFVATLTGRTTANNTTVDTDTDTGSITGDSEGNITFDFSGVTIEADTYEMELEAYDPDHSSGQKISGGPCGPYVHLKVCSVA